jgi:probable addiction module antidote protein
MKLPRDTSYDARLNQGLTDPKEAAAYLDAVMQMEDPATVLLALRQVAQAHGMAEVARRAEVGDKTLFKALSESGNPTLDTVTKVLHAVGLRLSVAPLPA